MMIRKTPPRRGGTFPRPRPQPVTPTGAKLRIIPLGGNEEVGRNCTIFEYGDDILILDMGLQFPEEDMPGIDYIIPNISYLKGKEKRIRAVLFSHGHMDHVGAAPILLEKLGYPPVVGRPLTLAIMKHRLEDQNPGSSKRLKIINIGSVDDKFTFGGFKVSFFQVEHSIMDAVGVILQTPVGTVVHPGDWTLDKDEKGEPNLDFSYLSKLPRPIILMLESLGATDVRKSATVPQMQKSLQAIMAEASGRVIIGTFSSQIERIDWIITAAEKLGKKVAYDGYSMRMNIEVAKEFGYVKAKKGTLIKAEEISKYPDNKIVMMATGAQGEENAVLSRIIAGSHRHVKIKKTDTIVLSSSVIPGNEAMIQRLKDGLYRQCENVIHNEIMDVHVSGHGSRDDIMHVIKQIKPDYFLPVYAYHYMLKEATKLAVHVGMAPTKMFVLDNGQVGEFDRLGGRATNQRVPTEHVFVDGLGIGDISNVVLRDRQTMADEGMLVVIATVDGKTGKLIGSPDIISRGFVYMKDSRKLIEDTRSMVKRLVIETNIKAVDDALLKDKIRNDVGRFLFQKTHRRPMILPVVVDV